jgi:hypothetical protein
MIQPLDYRPTGQPPVDDALKRVKEKAREVVNALNSAVSVRIKDVQLLSAGSQNIVKHGLGQAPAGYVVTYRSAAGTVYDAARPDEANLYLKTSADVIVDLVVF